MFHFESWECIQLICRTFHFETWQCIQLICRMYSISLCFCSILFRVNISLGPNEDRYLMTGLHTVKDIYCSCCQQILGWRYEKAYEESEKYKEGKFILEKARMWKEAR
ncbi:Os10g0369500 [Oryza sativa Japonica Group]|uniref:Protein yippee-like n=1 Tax=Oryza sativa subsp. japonica TaxID=39947 RepID=C7J7X2_ORYSJ|nr:Os10g0369500 [Oryza sativa Japonica Group]|eukprot:NP_001176118.1 Os10g0369500 [Oryza sativa Japonica Group]